MLIVCKGRVQRSTVQYNAVHFSALWPIYQWQGIPDFFVQCNLALFLSISLFLVYSASVLRITDRSICETIILFILLILLLVNLCVNYSVSTLIHLANFILFYFNSFHVTRFISSLSRLLQSLWNTTRQICCHIPIIYFFTYKYTISVCVFRSLSAIFLTYYCFTCLSFPLHLRFSARLY